MEESKIKKNIIEKVRSLGANLIRSCSVKKWEELPIQAPEFWPENIWPWSKHSVSTAANAGSNAPSSTLRSMGTAPMPWIKQPAPSTM